MISLLLFVIFITTMSIVSVSLGYYTAKKHVIRMKKIEEPDENLFRESKIIIGSGITKEDIEKFNSDNEND